MKTNFNPSAPTSGIPPDAIVYLYSATTALFFSIAMLLTLTEATMLLLRAWYTSDPTTRITQIPEGIFFALCAELNWRLLRRSRVRIAVNSEGIWRRRGGTSTFLAWNDMASVRANDTLQRLELTDRRGVVSIDVDYQIGDFERLRDYILSHTSEQAQLERVGLNVFHHTPGNKIIYTAIAAVLFYAAWQFHHYPANSLILPLAGVIMLFMILREPTSVVIGQDSIAVHYIGFQRDIPFNSISAIDLSDVRYRGNVWAGVLITTSRGARTGSPAFRRAQLLSTKP